MWVSAHNGGSRIIATAFDAKNGQTFAHHPPLPKTPAAGNTKTMATQSAILLTRPAAQSQRFADALRARVPGVVVVISPLIVPVFLTPDLQSRDWTGVIFSSETAVQAARRIAADGVALPKHAFCVGAQTAWTAREAGFDALSAEGDGHALLALVRAEATAGPLLYLCGREARFDLAKALSDGGIETVSAVVYAQNIQPLTAEATDLLQQDTAVLAPVFSPRTGTILAQELARIGAQARVHVVAISQAAGAAFPPQDVTTALHPDAPAMLQAVTSRLLDPTPP
jgi:uroporphyrinogen-III synthase